MSGSSRISRKKKFTKLQAEPELALEGEGERRRGPGRPKKDGQSPIPRKKKPLTATEESDLIAMDTDFVAMETDPLAKSSDSDTLSHSTGSLADQPSGLALEPGEIRLPSNDGSLPMDTDIYDRPISGLERSISEDSLLSSQPTNSTEVYRSEIICALCCCGEKSLLGQGDLLRFDPTPGFNPFRKPVSKQRRSAEDDPPYNRNERSPKHLTWRRPRGPPRNQRDRSKSPRRNNPDFIEGEGHTPGIDELSMVGHPEEPEVHQIFEHSGHTTAHHCCAAWSDGVCQNENFQLLNVDKAVLTGSTQRCSYCRRLGATINCLEPRCIKIYHYPCAASSGAFQGIKSLALLCPDHIDQAEERAIDQEDLECVICESPGQMLNLFFCTSCGQHYHGNCLDPPVEDTPTVRAGWQCPNCKICQTCRQPGDDNKMLVCDTCDKGYHTFCLKPAMTTIPKNGWKCKNCRTCSDCGSRTPGSGPSSRWHHNYTVCDSCYQQRNKGYFCPICGKAYRHHTTHKVMVQCDTCTRFVHADCDTSDSVTNYQQMKAAGHKATYNCPDCKHRPLLQLSLDNLSQLSDDRSGSAVNSDSSYYDNDGMSSGKSPAHSVGGLTPRAEPLYSVSSGAGEDIQASQDSVFSVSSLNEEDSLSSMDTDWTPLLEDSGRRKSEDSLSGLTYPPYKPTKPCIGGKPLDKLQRLGKFGRKHFSARGSSTYTGRRRGRPVGSTGKRGPKQKLKTISLMQSLAAAQVSVASGGGVPETALSRKQQKQDDEDDDSSMHTTVVLFSVTDKFTCSQDMCVSCGSFGLGPEGRLLTCSQCGQCYHPYCVNIKITKVVLSKGWRCLDCTVCEGCGKASDEGRLLLCDDCDISYHTYCLEPPLMTVPKGGWKCKWCVCCTHCGSTTPGANSEWMNNYTQCGPCASLLQCPWCCRHYREGDLICQCTHCDRWLHSSCDNMFSEEAVERAADRGYICRMCRPYVTPPAPDPPPKEEPPPPLPLPTPIIKIKEPEPPPKPPKQFSIEGVCLTEDGFKQIKSMSLSPIAMKRTRRKQSLKHGSLAILQTLADPNSDLSKVVDKEYMGPDDKPKDLASAPSEKLGEPQGEQPSVDAVATVPIAMTPSDTVPVTDTSAISVPEKKKRQRAPYRAGIGGFIARTRKVGGLAAQSKIGLGRSLTDGGVMSKEGIEVNTDGTLVSSVAELMAETEKMRKRRKTRKKSNLEAQFPSYIQEAFFGKSLLETSKDKKDGLEISDEDSRPPSVPQQLKGSELVKASQPKLAGETTQENTAQGAKNNYEGADVNNTDDPLNFLPQDELLGMLMGDGLGKNGDHIDIDGIAGGPTQNQDAVSTQTTQPPSISTDQSEHIDLESILSSNLCQMVPDDLAQIDGKEVEDLFSGVLSPTDHHQGPSSTTPVPPTTATSGDGMMGPPLAPMGQVVHQRRAAPTSLPLQLSGSQPPQANLQLPLPQQPRTPQDISSPPFSPEFAGPRSPWPSGPSVEDDSHLSYNQRNIKKWEKDEPLGELATSSPVLYANLEHPILKTDYPDWPTRAKQIAKLWRKVATADRQPYLQKARENRAAQRLKDAQKLSEGLQRKKLADAGIHPPVNSTSTHSNSLSPKASTPLGGVNSPGTPKQTTPTREQPQASPLISAHSASGLLQQKAMEVCNASHQVNSSTKPPIPPSSLALPMGSVVTTSTTPSSMPMSLLPGMNQIQQENQTQQVPGGLQRMNSAPGHIGMMQNASQIGPRTEANSLPGTPTTIVENSMVRAISETPGLPLQAPGMPPPQMLGGDARFRMPSQAVPGGMPPPEGEKGNHRQQLRELLFKNRKRREAQQLQQQQQQQQQWIADGGQRPPPPYPMGSQYQPMSTQFSPNDPRMPFDASHQRMPFAGDSQHAQHNGPGMASPTFNQSDPNWRPSMNPQGQFTQPALRLSPGGANTRPQGHFIELKRHESPGMGRPPRPRNLSRKLLQEKIQQRSAMHQQAQAQAQQRPMLTNPLDPYDHLVRQSQVQHPGQQLRPLQSMVHAPLQISPVGGGPTPMASPVGNAPFPHQQDSFSGGVPSSSLAGHHQSGFHPMPHTNQGVPGPSHENRDEHDPQLEDLFKDGDFNILEYADPDLDINKHSAENQQLFKDLGIGDDQQQQTEQTKLESCSKASENKPTEEPNKVEKSTSQEVKSDATQSVQEDGMNASKEQQKDSHEGSQNIASNQVTTAKPGMNKQSKSPISGSGKRDDSKMEVNNEKAKVETATDSVVGTSTVVVSDNSVKQEQHTILPKESVKQTQLDCNSQTVKTEGGDKHSSDVNASETKPSEANKSVGIPLRTIKEEVSDEPQQCCSMSTAATTSTTSHSAQSSPAQNHSETKEPAIGPCGTIHGCSPKPDVSESDTNEPVPEAGPVNGNTPVTQSVVNDTVTTTSPVASTTTTDTVTTSVTSAVVATRSIPSSSTGSTTLTLSDQSQLHQEPKTHSDAATADVTTLSADLVKHKIKQEPMVHSGTPQDQVCAGQTLASLEKSEIGQQSGQNSTEGGELSQDKMPTSEAAQILQPPQAFQSASEQPTTLSSTHSLPTTNTSVSVAQSNQSASSTSTTTSQGTFAEPSSGAERRRALLLEEQPLLLQDLLEKEKMEQSKQQQQQGQVGVADGTSSGTIMQGLKHQSATDTFLGEIDLQKIQAEAKMFAQNIDDFASKPPGPHSQMLLAMNRQHQQMLQQQQQSSLGMQAISPPAMSPMAGANIQGPRAPHAAAMMQPQSPAAGMDQFRGPLGRSNSGDIRQAMQSFGRVPTPVPGTPDPSNPFQSNSQGFAAQGPTPPPPRYAVPHPAASPHGSTPSPVPMCVRLPLSSPGHMSPMPSPSGQSMFGMHSRGPSPSPGPQMVGFPPRPSPPMPGHMVSPGSRMQVPGPMLSPGQRMAGPMRGPVPGMQQHMIGPRISGQGMPVQGMPGQGMPRQGLPGQGMPMQGIPGQGMQMQGIPGQGMPVQGIPAQGMPGHGIPSHGMGMGMAPGMRMQGRFPTGVPPHIQGMPGMGGMPVHTLQGQQLPFDPYEQNDEPPPDQNNTGEYEEWLFRRNQYLQTRLKFFESEAQKERKKKKSLSARQRNSKKNNKSFSEEDQKELEVATQRHNKVSKMLEISRKGQRQHSILIQEYGMKQQAAIAAPQHSPLGHQGRQTPMMQIRGPSPIMSGTQQAHMLPPGGMMLQGGPRMQGIMPGGQRVPGSLQGGPGMPGAPQEMQPPSPFMSTPQDPLIMQPSTPMMQDGMQSPMHRMISGGNMGMPGASPAHQPQMHGMSGASPAHQTQMQGMPGASPVHNKQMIPPGAQSPMVATGQHSPMITPGAQSPMLPPGAQSPMIQPGAQSPMIQPGAQSPMITPGQQSPMMQGQQLPPGSQSPMMPGTPSPMMRPNQQTHFPGPPTPGHPQSPMVPGPQSNADGKVAIRITDDNNPFSDGFQQRERQLKMREKQLAQDLEHVRSMRIEQGQTQTPFFDQNGLPIQQEQMAQHQGAFPVQSPMHSPFEGFPMPPSYPLSQPKSEKKPRKRARKKKDMTSPVMSIPVSLPAGMLIGQQELKNSLQILSGLLQHGAKDNIANTDMQALQSMVASTERTNLPGSRTELTELKLDPVAFARLMQSGIDPKLKEGILKGNQNLLLKQLLQGPSIVSSKGQTQQTVQTAQGQNLSQYHAQQLQLLQQQLQLLQQQGNTDLQKTQEQPLHTADATGNNTKDDEEEIKLTPEQQKQLEMIEKLPYVKKDGKATENDHQILLQIHKKGLETKEAKKETSSHHSHSHSHHHKHKRNKEHKKEKHKRKKKRKKGEEISTVEELMNAIKQLPPLPLSEPEVSVNFALCPLLGQGLPNGTSRLRGNFGHAVVVDGVADLYAHFPNGPANPPTPPASPLKIGLVNGPTSAGDTARLQGALQLKTGTDVTVMTGDEIMQEMQAHQRTITRTMNHVYSGTHLSTSLPTPPPSHHLGDRPSSGSDVVPSSSPELDDEPAEPFRMKGLKLITQNAVEMCQNRSVSPSIPIIRPTPRRVNKSKLLEAFTKLKDLPASTRALLSPGLLSGGTITVTLTLSEAASPNVKGVVAALSGLLNVPEPNSFEISDGASRKAPMVVGKKEVFPPSDAGLQRIKVDPNLSGVKFCKHCDVVILGEGFTKSSGNPADIGHIFCSSVCYMQYSISRQASQQNAVDFAPAVVNHVNNSKQGIPVSSPVVTQAATHRVPPAAVSAAASAVASAATSTSPSHAAIPATPISKQQPCDVAHDTPQCRTQTQTSSLLSTVSLQLQKSVVSTTASVTPSLSPGPAPPASSAAAVSPRPTSQTETVTTKSPSQVISSASTTPTVPQIKLNIKPPVRPQGKPALIPSSFHKTEVKDIKEEPKSGKPFRRKGSQFDEHVPLVKKWKNIRWKKWHYPTSLGKKYRPPSEQDIDELIKKLGTSLRPPPTPKDTRTCALCFGLGDGDTNGPARLLNYGVDAWIHLNCALWSEEVYETLNGALINVNLALKRGQSMTCCYCSKIGATICCHKTRCTNIYHFGCAIHDHCMFFKDKTMLCPLHCPSKPTENMLHTHVVFRRVYVSRDEHKQVASIMQQADRQHTLRVGSLIFHNLGQLLPHQLNAFHSCNAIYPVGYEVSRLYWSMRFTNKRCSYLCSVQDNSGKPQFTIKVIEQGHEEVVISDSSCKGVWLKVLEPIAKLRRDADMLKLFPNFLTCEDLFGFMEPALQRVLESLPGVELIQSYSFRFGRSPLIELPLAINPTGCARTEPKMRTHFRRPHTLTSNTFSRSFQTTMSNDSTSPYNKQFVHSKSSQYRKLKTEWKSNVYLGRSHIQGLGLFATHDHEKHTMVIEYIGTLIRNEVANRREKLYEEGNRGVYMFRIDNDTVVDATMSGNPARYINHSCNPNCVAEVVSFDKEDKIIIISNRKLYKGEELTYDYKFDFEDNNKIPCLCKAPGCKKWMN